MILLINKIIERLVGMTALIQPFGDKVLIKVLLPEEERAGGLLVAPVSKEMSNKGLVVAVGEGITLQDGTVKPLSIKKGDTVLFMLGTGIDFLTEKENYKILSSRDILGKFVESSEVNE